MNTDEREAAAKVLKAMAHPLRLGVIQVLADGERSVTSLFNELRCSQSLMSQQLRVLQEQGLISCRKDGAIKYCSLRNPELLKLFDCLGRHLKKHINLKS